MPAESRFRLERPFDIAEAFSQRRSGSLAVLIDERGELFEIAGEAQGVSNTGTSETTRVLGHRRWCWSCTRKEQIENTESSNGQENMPPVGSSSWRRGRASNSVFPSWYPRTPLCDTTAITRAIERRRARLGEENGETSRGQVPSQQVQDASPEQELPATTPSTIKKRPCPPPFVRIVHKILLEVAYQPDEGEFLTPQKKLLNSIDKVENVVMEELQRLKRTPSAKKAEREKRVRTLMSMR